MIRNKEIGIFLLVILLITIFGVAIGFRLSRASGFIMIVVTLVLNSAFVLFTFWRYKEIKRLSGYINKICLGDYLLDIRDNTEGELSILKDDIYKVTVMLHKQGEELKKDKVHLANAISDISHQLKTPLTSMIVMTDLLSGSNLSKDKRVEFTENIRVQLERIEWLVTSLLKLSKIDAGTVDFKRETIKVKELIEKSIQPLLIPMELKEHSLIINGDEGISFKGDFNWIREGIINILKNSIEHTPIGEKININFSENPIYTEILIKDSGEGIDKEDIPYIFKRFYKGKNSSEDSIGIGLAMSKTIAKSQGGNITVKSTKGEGTEFIMRFYKQIV